MQKTDPFERVDLSDSSYKKLVIVYNSVGTASYVARSLRGREALVPAEGQGTGRVTPVIPSYVHSDDVEEVHLKNCRKGKEAQIRV